MGQRSELHALLKTLLGSDHVYFQTPADLQMSYPCIRYELDDIDTDHANNKPYGRRKRYQVTVIHADPDNDIHDKVGQLPTSEFDRAFVAKRLNHFVYTLYF